MSDQLIKALGDAGPQMAAMMIVGAITYKFFDSGKSREIIRLIVFLIAIAFLVAIYYWPVQ